MVFLQHCGFFLIESLVCQCKSQDNTFESKLALTSVDIGALAVPFVLWVPVLIFTKTSLALVNSLLLKLSWTRLGAYLTSDYHPQPVSFIRTILSKPDKSIAMDASQDHCLSTDRDQYNYSVVESAELQPSPKSWTRKGIQFHNQDKYQKEMNFWRQYLGQPQSHSLAAI